MGSLRAYLRLASRMQSPVRVAEIRCLMCEWPRARVPPSPGLLGEHALDGPFTASGKSYDEPVVQGLSAGACRFGVFAACRAYLFGDAALTQCNHGAIAWKATRSYSDDATQVAVVSQRS